MTDNVPSKFATCPLSYGEKRAHLYAEDREMWQLHKTRAQAVEAVKQGIASGYKMVGLFKLDGLYEAEPVKLKEIT